MAPADERRSAAGLWVALLTVVWVLGVAALLLLGFFSSLNFTPTYEPDRTGSLLYLAAAVVAVVLPLIAAAVAFRGGRGLMGSIYFVLAVLVLVPAGLTAYGAAHDLGWIGRPPPSATPGPPGYCVEHSGGDTRCPGG